MEALDVLMPAKGMPLIEDEISARLPLHRLWLEPNPDLWLAASRGDRLNRPADNPLHD